jgi:hypothetical protein
MSANASAGMRKRIGNFMERRHHWLARAAAARTTVPPVECRGDPAQRDQDRAQPDVADERLVLHPHAPPALTEVVAERREQIARRADLDARSVMGLPPEL